MTKGDLIELSETGKGPLCVIKKKKPEMKGIFMKFMIKSPDIAIVKWENHKHSSSIHKDFIKAHNPFEIPAGGWRSLYVNLNNMKKDKPLYLFLSAFFAIIWGVYFFLIDKNYSNKLPHILLVIALILFLFGFIKGEDEIIVLEKKERQHYPIIGNTYHIFIGEMHKVIAITKHSETGETLVVHRSLEFNTYHATALALFNSGPIDKSKLVHEEKEKSTEYVSYPKMDKLYRHFKGGTYKTIAMLHHTVTNELMVLYKSVEFKSYHTRPLDSWNNPVNDLNHKRFILNKNE